MSRWGSGRNKGGSGGHLVSSWDGGVHQDAWVWSWLSSLGGYRDCRRWLKTLNIEVVVEIVNAFGIIFQKCSKLVQAPTHVTLLIVELWEINPSLSTTGAAGLLDCKICHLYHLYLRILCLM